LFVPTDPKVHLEDFQTFARTFSSLLVSVPSLPDDIQIILWHGGPFYNQKTVHAMAYDARTEMNTEDFADMVGLTESIPVKPSFVQTSILAKERYLASSLADTTKVSE
jgi:hypothetical protein